MPNDVLKTPAPWSPRVRLSPTPTAADVVDGRARLRAGAVQDLREDHVHRGAEKGDDQHRDRGADDTFASVTSDARECSTQPHVADEEEIAHFSLLGLGEEAHGLDERDSEEDDPGNERGDRDRDPDLLRAALDGLDELAVHITPDAARFLGDEPA